MSEKGQIILPKKIRDQRGYGQGSAFAVVESKSGIMTLRPVRGKSKGNFIDQLRKLKGLVIPEIRAHCPPRV
jgi:AbrB family looped-hinge helix DNA binding protein